MATTHMQKNIVDRMRENSITSSIPLNTPSPFELGTPTQTSTNNSNHDYLSFKPIHQATSDSSSPSPSTPFLPSAITNLKPPPIHIQHPSTSSPPDATSSPSSSSPHSPWPEASIQPDQQLTITLFSARHLQIRNPQRPHPARPYAVLEFDQTESVTDDALSSGTRAQKRQPKWRGFKHAADGSKSPIHASRSNSPPDSACSHQTDKETLRSSDGSNNNSSDNDHNHSVNDHNGRLYARSTSLSRTRSSSSAEEPVWNHTATFDILQPSPCMFISIYDRAAATESDEGFLGGTVIELEMGGAGLEEWIDLWDATGERCCGSIRAKIEFGKAKASVSGSGSGSPRVGFEHFEVLKLIGEGSYGQVYRVRKRDTRRIYAMKVLDKQRVLKNGKQTLQHVLSERAILVKTRSSPFLVGLKFSFQTTDALHLVMDLKSGGELMSYMQRYGGRFPEPWVVFYTAEILSGLSFLHSMDIIYRDLKPENCLLDATGHVALCDFGLSKVDMKSDTSTRTFCGTTEYMAPEILLEEGYTRAVDFWSLGVLIFEMTVGWTPFFSEDRVAKYSLILESDISAKIPKRGVDQRTREIILRLLERDPTKRLGCQSGSDEAKAHPFFDTIDWTALVNRRLRPPFRPRVESDAELSSSEQRRIPVSSAYGAASRRSSVDGTSGSEAFRNFTFSRDTSGYASTPVVAVDDEESVWQAGLLQESFKSFGAEEWDSQQRPAIGWRSGSRTPGVDRRSSEIGYLR